MAAGLGFKTFTTGEVLTAGDTNGYLMQGILVFATEAARNSAITSPQEGQFAFTKDTNSLWYYSGSAWVASGATGDIEGVTATSPLTGGGTSGTVTVGIQDASTAQRGSVQLSDSTATTSSILAATPTAVKSAYDLAAAAIPKSTVTTAGDIIYATGASAVNRLGIGTTGQVLNVAAGVPAWTTPSGGSLDYQLLNSGGTSLSGSTTTVSFSAQKALVIFLENASFTATDRNYLRFNSDSGSNYAMIEGRRDATPSFIQLSQDLLSSLVGFGRTSSASFKISGFLQMFGTDKTGVKPYSWWSASDGTGSTDVGHFGNGIYRGTSAITSVTSFTDGTYDAGKIYIYGAA